MNDFSVNRLNFTPAFQTQQARLAQNQFVQTEPLTPPPADSVTFQNTNPLFGKALPSSNQIAALINQAIVNDPFGDSLNHTTLAGLQLLF
jgi:hypothetical protein